MSGDIFNCRTWDGCYWHLGVLLKQPIAVVKKFVWVFYNVMQKNSNELSGQLNTMHGTSPQQSDPDPNVGGAEAEERGPPWRPPLTDTGRIDYLDLCQVLCWVFHTPLRTSECLLLRSHVYTCYTAHVRTRDVPLTCIHTIIPLTTSTGLGSQTVWVQTPCGHFLAGEAQASYLTSP